MLPDRPGFDAAAAAAAAAAVMSTPTVGARAQPSPPAGFNTPARPVEQSSSCRAQCAAGLALTDRRPGQTRLTSAVSDICAEVQ